MSWGSMMWWLDSGILYLTEKYEFWAEKIDAFECVCDLVIDCSDDCECPECYDPGTECPVDCDCPECYDQVPECPVDCDCPECYEPVLECPVDCDCEECYTPIPECPEGCECEPSGGCPDCEGDKDTDQEKGDAVPTAPKTGDSSYALPYAVASMLSLISIFLGWISKRRR